MAKESFLEKLEKTLECPLCKDIFNNPKTLTCLHSFCLQCIEKNQTVGLKNNIVFECPECHFSTTLPEGQAMKLQASSYITAVSSLFLAMDEKTALKRQETPPKCSCCNKTRENLNGFCAQCNGLVCADCTNVHSTKRHRNHNLVLLAEFQDENLDSYVKTQTLCQEKFHGKNGVKRIEYFCDEVGCQRCLCKRCCLLEHRKHRLLSMEEVTQKLGKVTNEDLKRMDDLSVKMGKDLDKLKTEMSRVESEMKVAKQKVHNAVEALVKKAREHEEEMLKTLEKRHKEYKDKNAKEQDEILGKKKQLEDFKIRCKTMIENSQWELARIQKHLKQFCQTLEQKQLETSNVDQDIKRNMTVHYVTDYVICQSIKNMGKIVESVTDKSHCSMEKLKEARYSFVNDMDYVTRSSKGDMSMATRWKRTFLWTKFNSVQSDNEKPPRILRAFSVS